MSDLPPPPSIADQRRKRSSGVPLTDDERNRLRAEAQRYARCRKSLHVPKHKVEEYERLAAASKESFSNWAFIMIERAQRGPGEAVRDLREENQRLRDELSGMRGMNGKLAVDNASLNSRIEALEGSLREAMHHALRLAGEVA
jgi:regulator of protease activity HflC (stomatin/prohibitin superfamily)